jgi:nitrite reductase/ring-hydroxylating ferredoxin subunit
MRNNHHYLLSLLFIFAFQLVASCKSDAPVAVIPYVFVYEEINLNDINYQNLKQPNGYAYVQNAGVRGILLVADGNNNYTAFDRACPYHPQEECAQVSMHSSGFYIEDSCCGSTFGTDYGAPTGGPARQSLRQYSTFVDGNYLIISNE